VGPRGPFFVSEAPFSEGSPAIANVHEKERSLHREISTTVESAIPGAEVLAVELTGPERMTVYIDHPRGVDLALCERVTLALDSYRREYALDVSSPGFDRPLRTQAHFRNAVGRKVSIRTLDAKKRVRGEVAGADATGVTVGDTTIPYESIVRANLIDEG
jgi:ribosome maturation factor RimP